MFNVELDDLTEEEDYHDQRIVENIHRHQIVAIFARTVISTDVSFAPVTRPSQHAEALVPHSTKVLREKHDAGTPTQIQPSQRGPTRQVMRALER